MGGDRFEIRVHGRGGQGVVTAAELMAVAAFLDGRYAQAFPSFGSERTGAPVVAFCRLADRPIRTREPVVAPDALIVQDATLLHQVNVFEGFPAGGYLLINSAKGFTGLGLAEFAAAHRPDRLAVVPATRLAREHLGRPVPNAALLGGFAAITGRLSLDAVCAAIRQRFPARLAAGNQAAATRAYAVVRVQLDGLKEASRA